MVLKLQTPWYTIGWLVLQGALQHPDSSTVNDVSTFLKTKLDELHAPTVAGLGQNRDVKMIIATQRPKLLLDIFYLNS